MTAYIMIELDGNPHQLTTEEARKLYDDLHSIFGDQYPAIIWPPDPVGPFRPFNPLYGPVTS